MNSVVFSGSQSENNSCFNRCFRTQIEIGSNIFMFFLGFELSLNSVCNKPIENVFLIEAAMCEFN